MSASTHDRTHHQPAAPTPRGRSAAALRLAAPAVALALGCCLGADPLAAETVVTGPIVAWGDNSKGQLTVPSHFNVNDSTVVWSIAAGRQFNLGILSYYRAIAWGDNSEGQTTLTGDMDLAAQVVAAGGHHSLWLTKWYTMYAFGDDSAGQTDVPTGLVDPRTVSAGDWHSLVRLRDGSVTAWGENTAGQCDVPAGLSGVAEVAAGGWHSLARTSAGTVVAWGCGHDWQYGQCSVPAGLTGVTHIAAGYAHSLALKNDGTVVAWGCLGGTDYGQCSVPAGLAGVTAVAAGHAHSLALKNDGTVVAWGCGGGLDYGQCAVPADLSGVTAVAAGYDHSLAVRGGSQSCTPSATALCLGDSRFHVAVEWDDSRGDSGVGMAAPLTGDAGYFWFFDATNPELMVKVLDGTWLNGHVWVFYGSLSNVEYALTVTDTSTGEVKTYDNPSGHFGSVGDTLAFPMP